MHQMYKIVLLKTFILFLQLLSICQQEQVQLSYRQVMKLFTSMFQPNNQSSPNQKHQINGNQGLFIQVFYPYPSPKLVSYLSSTSIENQTNHKIQQAAKTLLPYIPKNIQKLQNSSKAVFQQSQPSIKIIPKSSKKITTNTQLSLHSFPSYQSNPLSQSIETNVKMSQIVNIVLKSNYVEQLNQCKHLQKKFVDEAFPPTSASIGSEKFLKTVTSYDGWKRISEAYDKICFIAKKIDAQDVIQGIFGDCYFLSSIAVLAEDFPAIYERVFANMSLNDQGIYMARFYLQGIQHQVVVDDFIPVNKKKKSAFARISKQNQIWPIILEKCWAKLFNSYQLIDGGSAEEALYAFTGSPYGIKHARQMKSEEQLEAFKKLYKFKSKKGVLCCYIPSENVANVNRLLQKGLVTQHAYSILDIYIDPICVVKLRNPWGYNEASNGTKAYIYDWETNMKTIYGENGKKYLEQLKKYGADVRTQKDGQFWMHYDDFMTEFKAVTVCEVKLNLNLLSLKSNFLKNEAKFFYFDLKINSEVVVSLGQRWGKMEKSFNPQQPYAVTSLILAKQVTKKGTSQTKINSGKQSQIRKQTKGGFEVAYQFVSARSNNCQSSFNFLMFNGQLTPGRYVVYASANIRCEEATKELFLTVQSEDTAFPKEMTNLKDLFQISSQKSDSKSLINLPFFNDEKQSPEVNFLKQVLLDKALKDNNFQKQQIKDDVSLHCEENQTPSTPQTPQTDNQAFKQLQSEDSWYCTRIPSYKTMEKMGGFGYFVCQLSDKHPKVQSFEFSQRYSLIISRQYNKRFIYFVGNYTKNSENSIQLEVKPGETKIILMRILKPTYHQQINDFLCKYGGNDSYSAAPPVTRMGNSQSNISSKKSSQSKIGSSKSIIDPKLTIKSMF